MATAVRKKAELDLTKGSIMGKLVLYAIPFIFSNILQILFNAADIAVLGIFIPDKNLANDAVAAVGANTSMTNLIVNVFIAFSVGASVVLARYVGARNLEGARKTVGTSIAVALISGVILTIIGVSCAKVLLVITNCDPAIEDMATTYLRIYFLGMPITIFITFARQFCALLATQNAHLFSLQSVVLQTSVLTFSS